MKDMLLFQSYDGIEPYVFLRFDQADRRSAAGIIHQLIERQFRICYDEHDPRVLSDPDWLANRMLSADLVLFLISKTSLESLESRNCINYALSRKKRVFCIYLDDEKLEYGFDMQLATVPGMRSGGFGNAEELCEALLKTGFFVQDMRGEDAKTPVQNNRRKKVAIGILTSVLIIFLASAAVVAAFRMNYASSFAGQIENLTSTAYLDISAEDPSVLALLAGKTIQTLTARDMGLTDIQALGKVDCEELDLSKNPKINTLEPLLEIKNLKTVKVTQDMFPAIAKIGGQHPFRIVVTG